MVFVNVALTLLNCLLALPSCFDPAKSCLNGGICVKRNRYNADSAECSCAAGYGGEACEKVVNVCEAFPHYCNAGTCITVNGSAVCHCALGYFGQNCQYTFDKCKLGNICKNGGTCTDDMCFCVDGFSGESCERHVPERDDYLRNGCEEHPEFCALRFSDGVCNKECDSAKCFFDGFDCNSSTQKCRLADYCARHYMDGKCDKECDVAACGFDGMDCDRNTSFHNSPESNTVGIILNGSSVKILERIHSVLAKLAQKLHNPVLLALDNSNETRIYEWLFENGIGEKIDLKKQWKMSKESTGVLLYVDIGSAFCELRLHWNETNALPCFTDVFGAVAYLHTALYNETNDHMSLDDISVEELFVENERSRPLPLVTVIIAVFVFVVIMLSCVYGIHGFCDILKKGNVKRHAPLWQVPASQNNSITRWSTMSSSQDYCPPKKDVMRPDGLPPLSKRFSNSASCGRKLCNDFMNHSQQLENNEHHIVVNLDSYINDNGDGQCFLGSDLLKAVKCNDVKAVSLLVFHGADVNSADSDGNTALHHAVIMNSVEIIRLLLSSYRCNLRMVNILGQTALTLTVKFAHVSDICARCILDFMYAEHYRQSKSPTSTFVPQQYASLPRSGISQSMFITSADIQQFDRLPKQLESYSNGCLFSRNILSERDDPTLSDVFGRTALHYAALNSRLEILPTLYVFGLKLDTQDNKGETALYLAAREGHLGVVELLLSFGANRSITDQLGRAPLDIARERGHDNVVDLLENLSTTASTSNIMQALKRKRKSRKQPNAERECKPTEKSQLLIAPAHETASLTSSTITIKLNDDCVEDTGDIEDGALTSDSLLNSVTSFVLTPPEQILAEAEKELGFDVADPALPDYFDLSTESCLPPEFFQDNPYTAEPLKVIEDNETLSYEVSSSGTFTTTG